MKKLFTFLLFISLALLTTECRVSNLEPVPPNSTKLRSVDITEPFKVRNDVFQMSLKTGSKIASMTTTEIIILGDYVISKPNAKISAETLPDGSIVVIDLSTGEATVDQNPKTAIIKVLNSLKITGGIRITYKEIDWFQAFDKGSMSFVIDVTSNLNQTIKISTDNWKSEDKATNYKAKISATTTWASNFRANLKCSIRLEGSQLKYLRAEINHTLGLNVTTGVEGEIEKALLYELGNFIFPDITIILGGLPVKITPVIIPRLKLVGKMKVSGEIELLKGSVDRTLIFQYDGTWSSNQLATNSQSELKAVNSLKAKIAGELRGGLEFDILLIFYKTSLKPTLDIEFDAGRFGATFFGYGGLNVECDSKSGKPVIGTFWGIEVGPKAEILSINVTNTLPKAKYESKPPTLYPASINVTCEILPSTLINANPFRSLLNQYGFPINEGNSPPKLTEPESIYFGNPTILKQSSDEGNDLFNYFKEHGPVKYRFSNQQPNSIKVESKRKTDRVDETTLVNVLLDKSSEATITGNGNKFTIIGKCAGDAFDEKEVRYSGYVAEFAISGEKINQTVIQNVHYAFRIIAKSNDPNDILVREGVFRYFTVTPLGAVREF